MQKKFYLIIVITISLVFILGALSSAIDKDIKPYSQIPSQKMPSKDIKEKKKFEPRIMKIVKPDLVVERIEINNFSSDDDSRKVRVTVFIKNKGTASTAASLTADGTTSGSGGSFKASIEWTDNPASGWNYLCGAGFTALAAGATDDFHCDNDVPKGTARKFRATVDTLDWISELNEINNVQAAGFVSR